MKNAFQNNYQNYIYQFKFKENALAEKLKFSHGTLHDVTPLERDSPMFIHLILYVVQQYQSCHIPTLEFHGPPPDVK